MAESLKVVKITIEELMKRMDKMEIGEVIGLANYVDENTGEGEGWFGLTRIDLCRVDQDSKVWVIEWFGGSGNPSIMTDYDNGEYLEDDLRRALKDKELIQEDGTIFVDEDEFRKGKHLYIVETERLEDECWMVDNRELMMEITDSPEKLIEKAKRWPLKKGQLICVRKISDDIDWRKVETVEPEMYTNIFVRVG